MRLFIALDIEPEVRKTLTPVYTFLVNHTNIMKVVPPDDYHITLKFLGECRTGLYEDIKKSFNQIFKPREEIRYSLKGLGAFPELLHANVIWSGIHSQSDSLKNIFEYVESFTGGFGFPREKRAFTPHLTLARVKKGMKLTSAVVQFIRDREQIFFAESRFVRLALYSSTLTPKGPCYRIEEEIVLK